MEKSEKPVNKPLYIFIAIVIACSFWLFVRTADNPDTPIPLENIPITFVGEDVLNSRDLMVVDKGNESVDLKVQGKWSIVSRLRRDNVSIRVDLRNITSAGQHNVDYEIVWPAGISMNDLSVLDRDPLYISVTVTRQVSRPLEVRGKFEGSIAEGYQADAEGFVFQPNIIEISGEQSLVSRVAYAQVTLNRKNLNATVQEEMPYVLIGHDGTVIDDDNLITTPATVSVTYPVVMVKQVPLTIDLIPGGGADPKDASVVTCEITPSSIMLSGDESDLAAYSRINLGKLDLAKVIQSSSWDFDIVIGDEVENISGVQKANVQVTVKNLAIREFIIDDIEIINAPAGVASVVTQFLTVRVRGTQEALDMVVPQYIKVVVDLKDKDLAAGQNAVTPKVMLNGISGAGVIGDYKVSIFLTRSLDGEGNS